MASKITEAIGGENMELKDIANRIYPVCRKYKIEHMYLFGSQARGNTKSDSDADFYLDWLGAITSIITLSGFRLEL